VLEAAKRGGVLRPMRESRGGCGPLHTYPYHSLSKALSSSREREVSSYPLSLSPHPLMGL